MTAFLDAYPWVPMLAIVAAVIFGALLAVRAQIYLDAKRHDALTSERFDEENS